MWLSLLKPLVLCCHHAHSIAPKASFILHLYRKFCAQAIYSPTSTQTCSPPPLSGPSDLSSNTASCCTSWQNAPSSQLNLGPAHPLTFSPRPNSSQSSVASMGSSYHSDDGLHKKDHNFDLFSDRDTQYSPWHRVSSTEKTSPVTHEDSQDPSEAKDILKKHAGLTKSDFIAIQEKLVGAGLAKAATSVASDQLVRKSQSRFCFFRAHPNFSQAST
jgi:serine/arginine repetitive matrix protein 2